MRPATLIHDETIPTLLHQAKQLTFVTINVDDFWKKALANRNYSIVAIEIVAIELEQGQALQVPLLIRRLLRLPAFRTKVARMGKSCACGQPSLSITRLIVRFKRFTGLID